MTDMNRDELEAKLDEIDAAPPERKVELMRELAKTHGAIDIDQIEIFVAVADNAVRMALEEIVAIADHLNTAQVPVSVLRELIGQPSSYGRAVYSTVEHLGFELGITVPDDLSELDGLA